MPIPPDEALPQGHPAESSTRPQAPTNAPPDVDVLEAARSAAVEQVEAEGENDEEDGGDEDDEERPVEAGGEAGDEKKKKKKKKKGRVSKAADRLK